MTFYGLPIDMCLPTFDIYQGEVASDCFTLDIMVFSKKVISKKNSPCPT